MVLELLAREGASDAPAAVWADNAKSVIAMQIKQSHAISKG